MTRPRRQRTGAGQTMNADHIGMHRFIVAAVAVTLAAAVLTSWNGLAAVAEWQQLAPAWSWLTPLMVDVPLVALTCARGALRQRTGRGGRWLLAGIVALTAYSSAVNGLHTLVVAGQLDAAAVVGALTNALAPWLILGMTEVLWLVITHPRPQPAAPAHRRRQAANAHAVPLITDADLEAAR